MKFELDLTPEQITLLREAVDEIPLGKYISLVVAILPQLPLESDAALRRAGADSTPPSLESRETGGGFRLTAYTPRGVSLLDALDRVLGNAP